MNVDVLEVETSRAGVARGKRVVRALVERAGIQIDGSGPRSVRVVNDEVYSVALTRGFDGLRDAYVDGWWDADQLDVITELLLSHRVALPWAAASSLFLSRLSGGLRNRQSRWRNGRSRRHYDLGNDLYRAMLDPRMMYSCGYWRGATRLDEAQENKLELVCRKLGLERGMRVLDIGCGWGGFAKFAAERHGVSVVGITISEEQARLARDLCTTHPVTIRLQDYRELAESKEQFDRIVSLGMLEHVGHMNYRRYLSIARNKLAIDGLCLLQTIGGNVSKKSYDPWMNEHIFPNVLLPSAAQLTLAAEGLFVVEDWHNMGADYDPTLMSWFENFDRSWPDLRGKYGDRFYRIWKCYLLTCAGSFRARVNQVWQVVLSPSGVRGGYVAVR